MDPRTPTRLDKIVRTRGSLALAGLIGAATVLYGCNPARLVSTLTPSDGTEHVGTFAYGSDPRQRLDLYRPTEGDAVRRPVVVFFYGGRWQGGARQDYRFVANALAAEGMVVVIPDYRVYPEVRFPAFVEDGAAAVLWTRSNAARFGGDPQRVFLMGHSAGAHIAALLAFDERYLGGPGDASRLAGVIGLAGPYDFLPLSDATLKDLFGPPERYADSQPVNFIEGGEPPALLLHGARDRAVWPRNTYRLAETIERAGGRVTIRIYPELEHARVLGALARPFRDWAPVHDDILEFIAATTPIPPFPAYAAGHNEHHSPRH